VLSLVAVFVVGLNFGIDFKGGVAVEVKAKQGAADLAELRHVLDGLGLGEVTLQEFGSGGEVLVRVQRQEGGPECVAIAARLLSKSLGPEFKLAAASQGAGLALTLPRGIDDGTRKRISDATGLSEAQLPRTGSGVQRIDISADQRAEWCQQVAILAVKDALADKYDFRRTESVGPKVGSELLQTGIIAMLATLLAIAAYVWFRFEWQFGVGALIALLHDVVSTVGVFVLFQLDFSLTALAVLLTIAGYSINDTVVVFDRVRENLRRYKRLALVDILNVSINETLSRTIMTSSTVFVACVALALFGGPVLHSFAIGMLWGVIVGTYSSIWIACAGLVFMKLRPEQLRHGEEAAKAKA